MSFAFYKNTNFELYVDLFFYLCFMAEEKIYPKGISYFDKRENAPEWVKGSLVISINQFTEWLNANSNLITEHEKYGNQIKFTLTEKGLQVDTWKPKNQIDTKPNYERKTAADNIKVKGKEVSKDEDFSTTLPF
jgi:hypothetical protein